VTAETDVLKKIGQRGFWDIRVRPETYDPNPNFPLADLLKAVSDSMVSLRGWSFPRYNQQKDVERRTEYVGQATDWSRHVEIWRAYKSKQFVLVKGIPDDWRDQPGGFFTVPENWKAGGSLSVTETAFRFVEAFEFAARWSRAFELKGSLVIEFKIRRLAGRQLEVGPEGRDFFSPRVSTESDWSWPLRPTPIPISDLLGNTRELAVEPAIRLFELFGWDVRPEVIRGIQAEIGRPR
jgi:hypothetical protein